MNRYPVWKFAIIVIALLLGMVYTLPNFFGEAPAVQVSSSKMSSKVDAATLARVEDALKAANVPSAAVTLEGASIKARFETTEQQLKAKDAIQKALIPEGSDNGYVVALNLLSRSPAWLTALSASPMYLGLDLRGGVHFMLQVDMKAALSQKTDSLAGDIRTTLREKDVRHGGITRNGQSIEIKVRDQAQLDAARRVMADQFADLQVLDAADGGEFKITANLKPDAARRVQEQALKQNITTLHNRINELGVAEPVIQQQGLDRIVVQLPGVQDTAKAKDILGRTATLEVRLVDESSEARSAEQTNGLVPFGSERYLERNGQPVIVKKQVILTGDNLTDAQPGFDGQTQEPVVNLSLDGKGARIFKDVTRENVGKRMAILLFEKGKGEVVTAPVIRSEIGGGRVQISGRMTTSEANDTALLLRAGSLAAPMEIIEERTILAVNLLLLVAVLSMLQATLTLPGMAAMALALGMAIDSNVLINERVREELRLGASPQAAIHTGYDRAWATIFDSNITTLIAGVALLAFGSGPVRGFAVVHCLGILTSMFSAVFFSRGLVNLWYGRQKKLKSVSIGTVWRPDGSALPATIDDKA